MLVIRLSRTGRNKYPTYRIVAADSRRAATGKFVMILGHYNPHTKELVIKKDETIKFLDNGAQPSNAVIKLLKQDKIKLPEWTALKTRNRPAKKAAKAEAPAAAAEVEAAPAEAASAETPEAAQPEAIAEVAEAEAEAVADNASSENQVETAAAEQAEAETAAKVADETPDSAPAE